MAANAQPIKCMPSRDAALRSDQPCASPLEMSATKKSTGSTPSCVIRPTADRQRGVPPSITVPTIRMALCVAARCVRSHKRTTSAARGSGVKSGSMMSVAGLADSRLAATQKLTKPPRRLGRNDEFFRSAELLIACLLLECLRTVLYFRLPRLPRLCHPLVRKQCGRGF